MVLSLDRFVGKTAIVTGASIGIGEKIAEELVKAGVNVVGLARRKENVEALAKKLAGEKGKLFAVKADLSKEEEILNAFKWTKENVGPVHILVNNAGLNQPTDLIDGQTELWKKILDVNVLGLCIATREAVKQMRDNHIDGHIVHINGILGHKVVDFPGANVYPASKHAVTALTETLRLELNRIGSKIKITSVSPGVVVTEFQQTAGYTRNMSKEAIANHMANFPMLKPEDVADSVLYVLSTPAHVQVHELMVKPIGARA